MSPLGRQIVFADTSVFAYVTQGHFQAQTIKQQLLVFDLARLNGKPFDESLQSVEHGKEGISFTMGLRSTGGLKG